MKSLALICLAVLYFFPFRVSCQLINNFDGGGSSRSLVSESESSDIRPGVGMIHRREDSGIHFRLFGGLGVNAAKFKEAPLAYAFGAAYQVGNQVFSGSFIHNESISRQPPRISWDEFDLLYGYGTTGLDLIRYGFRANELYLAISSGFGFYSYDTRYQFRRRSAAPPTDSLRQNSYEWGFGIPIQLQASYSLIEYVGLGITLFGNLNTKHIMYGATATIQFYYF